MENEIKSKSNVNEIYKKLESNLLVSYEKITNNKIIQNFSLNDKEKECFSIIMDIIAKNNLSSVVCRVAGGWVRDKLLGKDSDDIDIAVSGIEAWKLVYSINTELYPKKFKMGIIPKNPEKGKNIEVTTTNICNISIDFINLRIDEKRKSTPAILDAELRDLSINSMFYNINEQKVEDFTQRGIKDLEQGIINTPVDSDVAILNDSFIILRMLRFAIKFKFRIDDTINNYLEKNRDIIIKNFYTKVSKERIEKEMSKIFQMDNSEYVIAYLCSFKLLDIIYLIKNYDSKNNFDTIFLKTANLYILGEYLLKKGKIFDNIEITEKTFKRRDYCFLLLTLYFRDKTDKLNVSLNQKILKSTYRASNGHQQENKNMCRNFDDLYNMIKEEKYDRFKVGKALRRISYKNIIHILYACIAYEYIENFELNSLLSEINEDKLQKIIEKNKKFLNYVINEDMLHIDKIKPLFPGKELLEILDIKTDKMIKPLLDYLIDEQIKNPKLDKEQAIKLLNKKLEELYLEFSDKSKNINDKKNEKENIY